jgi:hypothetical protein
MPRELGKWGIKNIYRFCISLATKFLWRLIHKNLLWGRVMASKYIPCMEWIILPGKSSLNGSNCWKEMVKYFPLIGYQLVWNVGNGKSIRNGEDPWINSGEGYKVVEGLVNFLHYSGIYSFQSETQTTSTKVCGGRSIS